MSADTIELILAHTGLIQWIASGERGASSNTIVQHLTGLQTDVDGWLTHPADPDDLDRCLKLLEAVPTDAETIIRALLDHIERNTCEHHETYRGGLIWEICAACGAKFADDEGGMPEFKWPEPVERARAFLLAAPTTQPATQPAVEQGEPFGDMLAQIAAEFRSMTPEQRKQALDASKDHDLAIAIRALNEAPTDAHLHQIINDLEAALDEAGAPAGTMVDRIAALGEDAARWRFSVTYRDDLRMNWLVVYDEWDGDGDFTAAIDAAREAQPTDLRVSGEAKGAA